MEETAGNIVYQCFCSLFMNVCIVINIFSIFLLFIQSRENRDKYAAIFILDFVSIATIIQLLSVKVCY